MKKIVIYVFLLIVILFGLFFLYSWKKGGELLFDMDKINGVSDNNKYGIRNNVYTYMEKVLSNPDIPELKEEKIRNLFLNFAKSELTNIKYFSNKSRSIEIILKTVTIMECIYETERINEKYKKINEYFAKEFVGWGVFGKKSNFETELNNSKDIETIQKILNHYTNGMTLNPDDRSPWNHIERCDKYMNKVLDENEFWE